MNFDLLKKAVDKIGGWDVVVSQSKKIASNYLFSSRPTNVSNTTHGENPKYNDNSMELSEDMTEEEEIRFMEIQKRNLMNASEVESALSILNKEVLETIKFCEVQKTKREKIKAVSAIRIHQITAMTSYIKDYLNRSFDERSNLFENYFNILDKAISSNDLALITKSLDSINSLANTSPFKDLNDIDKVSEGLINGKEWEI